MTGCAGGDVATSGFSDEATGNSSLGTTSAESSGGTTGTSAGSQDSGSGTDTAESDGSSGSATETTSGSESGSSSSGDTGEDCVEEVCDGFDNDCDDEIDEGCACSPEDTQPCYSGDPGTAGVGACQNGTQTCDRMGQWGASCEGEVVPSVESCNAIDDDCDGETDEDFDVENCGEGVCQQMVDTCEDGTPQVCTPLDPPDPVEDCDGADDDCDGSIDEGCSCVNGQQQACYPGPIGTEGVGICAGGTQTCVGGQWGACNDAVVPEAETCDAEDDDCDGTADEGTGGNACNTGLQGVCAQGQQVCNGGMLQCSQTVFPGNEVCDGLDNDCDTGVDEGTGGAACMTLLPGICASGTQQCVNGGLQCQQNFPPMSETCNNTDDDCDGTADEGNPGGGVACGTGQPGICAAGTTACSNGMIQCNQNLAPGMETCNGMDDNCNGVVDDAGPEICGDALDNDCDGVVDDGCIMCGNGVCEGGETSCTCGSDCPDDPFTCSPCQCGGYGGACYCDSLCTFFGDCCGNACAVCGYC